MTWRNTPDVGVGSDTKQNMNLKSEVNLAEDAVIFGTTDSS